MKKLMHGLIATVLFGFVGNSQKKSDLEKFSIIETQNITLADNIVKRFLEVTKFESSNTDVTIDAKTIELLGLKNSYQAIKFNINGTFANLMYAIYNREKDDFIWFFVNNTKSKIEVLSPERILVSAFIDSNGFVDKQDVIITNSVFGDCMEAVEKDFTDNFVGYVLWNTTPLPALTAAVNCEGCSRGWTNCPPAYVATLPKK